MATGVSARRYSAVAILLHWASALGVIALIGMGLIMTHAGLAPMRQFQLYQWHKSVGVTVLGLTILRVLWRLTHRPPPHPAGCRRGSAWRPRRRTACCICSSSGCP